MAGPQSGSSPVLMTLPSWSGSSSAQCPCGMPHHCPILDSTFQRGTLSRCSGLRTSPSSSWAPQHPQALLGKSPDHLRFCIASPALPASSAPEIVSPSG